MSALAALRRWTIAEALPFWLDAGRDRASGRFRERLDLDGRPLDVPHRAMVQARQVFVFAEAVARGWIDPGDAPARAMAVLEQDAIVRSGGMASTAFAVDRAGRVVAAERDAYTHAFLLLALAALGRWTGERRWRLLADEVAAFVERELWDPRHGGLHDRLPDPPPFKRQNPLMHLFEAWLALAEAFPGGGFEERAAALAALFGARLCRGEPPAILEHHAPDWSAVADPALAGRYEPGHHFEWVWLLDRYATLSGERIDVAGALYARARAEGRSAAALLFDEVDAASGRPAGAHRLWPHGEAVRAGMVTGDVPFAEAMADVLNRRFLGRPFAAGWIDRQDAAGAPLVDHVPASSLYHLATAAFAIDAAG